MINYTASPLDSNKTLLQAFHYIETYLKNNPIYKVYTANIGYTPGTNTYMLNNINVGENTIAEKDVIFFNNAYVGIVSAVGSTEVTVKNVTGLRGADGQGVPAGGTAGQILAKKTDNDYDTEWIDAPSGGDTGNNILQQSYMLNRQAGVTQGDMVNLGYSLGLELGKQYKVKYKFNDTEYSAVATYNNAKDGFTTPENVPILTQYVDIGVGSLDYPLPITGDWIGANEYGLIYISDGHKIIGDQEYEADANNASLYVRALGSGQNSNAVSIEILSIEEHTEIVADRVQNKLTITVNGEAKEYDGSGVVDVNITSYRHTIVINNAIDTAPVFNLYNNSPEPINTVGKLIQAVGVQKGSIQINAISRENFPNYIIFYTSLTAPSQGNTITFVGTRFNLSGTQPAQIKSISDVLVPIMTGDVTDTVTQI